MNARKATPAGARRRLHHSLRLASGVIAGFVLMLYPNALARSCDTWVAMQDATADGSVSAAAVVNRCEAHWLMCRFRF